MSADPLEVARGLLDAAVPDPGEAAGFALVSIAESLAILATSVPVDAREVVPMDMIRRAVWTAIRDGGRETRAASSQVFEAIATEGTRHVLKALVDLGVL